VPTSVSTEPPNKTLVIVDMQLDMSASRAPWLLASVHALIDRARKENIAIVMLEYLSREPLRFYGETYPELVCAARGHSHFAMRAKADADGSEAVAAACQSLGLESQDFIVCGVNTHACVQATALGLLRLFPACAVEVAASACNDYRGNNWQIFPRGANLSIV
jgi:nicotinamidase-related amidase